MPVLPLQSALRKNYATLCNISEYFSIVSVNSNTRLHHERLVDSIDIPKRRPTSTSRPL